MIRLITGTTLRSMIEAITGPTTGAMTGLTIRTMAGTTT
jgi:hypothetical protein